jgi:hypothetical protein
LTYFLRQLSGNPDGEFECSDLAISCTVGIWMWPELIPWVDPKTKKTKKILLLDIEGNFPLLPLAIADFLLRTWWC